MEKAQFRRVPKQARARERYMKVLASASNLFIEKGYEATTTNEIASRAGISIGSLYQYFNNKESIVEAMMDHYVTSLREVTDRVLSTEVGEFSTPTAVHLLLQPIIEFHAEHPAFRSLWLAAEVSTSLHRSMKKMDREVLRHVEQLLIARAPVLPPERARMVINLLAAVTKGLLSTLGRLKDEAQRDAATAEVERMLSAYLDTVITVDPSAH